jgi:hypothetical protein
LLCQSHLIVSRSPLWRIAQLERLFQYQKQGIDLALEYSDMGAELEDDDENRPKFGAFYIHSTSPTWHIAMLRYFPGMSKGIHFDSLSQVVSLELSSNPTRIDVP